MKILKWLAFTPLALIALAFCIANRHLVTVSFDPFSGNDVSSPQITAPLWILLLITVAFGALLGGFSTWVAQGKHRKAARVAQAEATKWHEEADRLRAQIPQITPLPVQSRALVRSY